MQHAEGANVVRLAVEMSGLSARVFAENICWRDERTIRRWVSGDQAVPMNALRNLVWFLLISGAQRKAIVNAASSNAKLDYVAARRMRELRESDNADLVDDDELTMLAQRSVAKARVVLTQVGFSDPPVADGWYFLAPGYQSAKLIGLTREGAEEWLRQCLPSGAK
jgi:hypothetical protein